MSLRTEDGYVLSSRKPYTGQMPSDYSVSGIRDTPVPDSGIPIKDTVGKPYFGNEFETLHAAQQNGLDSTSAASPAPRKVTVSASERQGEDRLSGSRALPQSSRALPQSSCGEDHLISTPRIGSVGFSVRNEQKTGVGLAATSVLNGVLRSESDFKVNNNVTKLPQEEAIGPFRYPSHLNQNTSDVVHQLLQEEQIKTKVQRVRIATLQKQIEAREAEFREQVAAARTENLRIVTAMKTIEKDREEIKKQCHDLNQKLFMSEKVISEKDNQLHRQLAKTTSIEKELKMAVLRMQTISDHEGERRAAEAAALENAFSEQSRLKTENQKLKKTIDESNRVQEDTNIEMQRLHAILKTTETLNEHLRAEINKMQQAKVMSEWEAESIQALLPRMDETTAVLEQFFTFREVKIECERLNGQLRSVSSIYDSLKYLKKIIANREMEIGLLRAEADRALSLGVPPSITANVDAHLVTEVFESEQDEGVNRIVRLKPHILLRQHKGWMEIRDTGTGKLCYVTGEISDTPFCPIQIATEKEKAAEEQSKVEELKQLNDEAVRKAVAEEVGKAVAKAIEIERAKHLTNDVISDEVSLDSPSIDEETNTSERTSTANKIPDAQNILVNSYRQRLIRFFETHNPSRLNTVDMVMDRFKGRYDVMLSKLIKKYGPEPVAKTESTDLPAQIRDFSSILSSQTSVNGNTSAEIDIPESNLLIEVVRPLRNRLIRLLNSHDPTQLQSVDGYVYRWMQEGLSQLVAQLGAEPDDKSVPLPVLPPQLPVGGDPATDPYLQPFRRRLIRLFDKYDRHHLSAVNALIRAHPTQLQSEALLKRLIVRYGPEPIDDNDARIPNLPPQVDVVPSLFGAPSSFSHQQVQHALSDSTDLSSNDEISAAAEEVKPRLYRMIRKYAPGQLGNLNIILSSFEGEFDLMFEHLVARYGPEPEDDGQPIPANLPTQAKTQVIAARKRATSMRQASPAIAFPNRKSVPTSNFSSSAHVITAAVDSDSQTVMSATPTITNPIKPHLIAAKNKTNVTSATDIAKESVSSVAKTQQEDGGSTGSSPSKIDSNDI